jgi:hypothetical protein
MHSLVIPNLNIELHQPVIDPTVAEKASGIRLLLNFLVNVNAQDHSTGSDHRGLVI